MSDERLPNSEIILSVGYRVKSLRAGSQREKEAEREAIRRLNPAIPEEAGATIRRNRRVQIERRLNP